LKKNKLWQKFSSKLLPLHKFNNCFAEQLSKHKTNQIQHKILKENFKNILYMQALKKNIKLKNAF